MNEPWTRIKIQPWTDGDRRGRVLIAHDRLGGRRILRRLEPLETPLEASFSAKAPVSTPVRPLGEGRRGFPVNETHHG